MSIPCVIGQRGDSFKEKAFIGARTRVDCHLGFQIDQSVRVFRIYLSLYGVGRFYIHRSGYFEH